MKHLFIASLLTLIILSPLQAAPLTTEDKDNLLKVRHMQHILYESYLVTDKGLASVFGYHFDTYFHDNFAFVLAIFGAVEGERGGYGIAAYGLAYTVPLSEKLLWDTRLLTGSGGGGGLDAGGGFMLEAQTGVSYQFMDNLFLDLKYGYLQFPTGTFETPIVNFGVSFQHYGLFLPY